MGWKHIVASSAATGALLAIFILGVFVLAEIDPGSFGGLCGSFFALSALSAYIVNEISKRADWPEVGLKKLIPVAFITSIIPLFGPLFGLPNNDPITLATVVLFGVIGGAFWSIPFAGWAFYSERKTTQIVDSSTPVPVILTESE